MPSPHDNHPLVLEAQKATSALRAKARESLDAAEAAWQRANADYTRQDKLCARIVRIAYLEAELEALKAKDDDQAAKG